jgi:hypothetical protein
LDRYTLRIHNLPPLTYCSPNQALIPLLGREGGVSLSWINTLSTEQFYKWLWHHAFTKNLEALDLWVLSLIKCSTSISSNQCESFYSHLINLKRFPHFVVDFSFNLVEILLLFFYAHKWFDEIPQPNVIFIFGIL